MVSLHKAKFLSITSNKFKAITVIKVHFAKLSFHLDNHSSQVVKDTLLAQEGASPAGLYPMGAKP